MPLSRMPLSRRSAAGHRPAATWGKRILPRASAYRCGCGSTKSRNRCRSPNAITRLSATLFPVAPSSSLKGRRCGWSRAIPGWCQRALGTVTGYWSRLQLWRRPRPLRKCMGATWCKPWRQPTKPRRHPPAPKPKAVERARRGHARRQSMEAKAMGTTGLEVFDKTLHTTNLWLDEICAEIGPDKHLAWHVLGAVLRSIRDELLIGQSAHLAAQLPLLVRGAYFDQYRPAAQPVAERSHEDFIARIRQELAGCRPVRPDLAATAVMRTLNRHITEGQIKKARDALPKGIRALWPEPEQTAKSATAAPRAEVPAPGAPLPSRDAVEGQPERTGAATGTPSMAQSAPGSPSATPVGAEPAAAKAAERAMSDQGGANRAGAKMRTRRKGKLPAEP